MFVAEDLAACPGVGYTTDVSLTKCWADSEHVRRERAQGRDVQTVPCRQPADEDSIGLCPSCYEDMVA